jgi:hypothetical protein
VVWHACRTEVGNGAEGVAAQGRGRGRRLEGRDDVVDVLPARRRGHMLGGMASPDQACGPVERPAQSRNGSSGRRNERPDPPKWYRAFELPLLGSNQDTPDPECSRPGRGFDNLLGNGHFRASVPGFLP